MQIDYSQNIIFHYVYRLDCLENGQFYIGLRSCRSPIELDYYFGSGVFTDKAKASGWKLLKTVLSIHDTRSEAMVAESRMIKLFIDNNFCSNINGIKHSTTFRKPLKDGEHCSKGHNYNKSGRHTNGKCLICYQAKLSSSRIIMPEK